MNDRVNSPEPVRAADAVKGEPIRTDMVIVGAGPVGLFAVFEAGLLNISASWSTISTGPAASAPSSIRTSRSTTFRRCRAAPASS